MNIIFASGNPHLPQIFGGVEVNTHELALEFGKRGHNVAVLSGLSLRTAFGVRRALKSRFRGLSGAVDHTLGYPTFRGRRPSALAQNLDGFTVAVVQNGAMLEIADGFCQAGVPSIAYFHGLAFEVWPRGVQLPFRSYLANSEFTAGRFRSSYAIDPLVVPPIFRRERYFTEVTGKRVTFINPVPEKGSELALEVAAQCSEIPFCFVLGWSQSVGALFRLRSKAKQLGNVEIRQPASDMRAVYRESRIVLMPSQCEETWGRVASEAQISGIPIVASNQGALPETVGPGGMILGYREPPAVWAAAIRKLWADETIYRRLSQAALSHSKHPQLDPDAQVSAILAVLHRVGSEAPPSHRYRHSVADR